MADQSKNRNLPDTLVEGVGDSARSLLLWQCLDCNFIGGLSRAGKCKRCNSNAVTTKLYVDTR